MRSDTRRWFVLITLASCVSTVARADEVTDWNKIMLEAALAAVPPTSPLVMTRVAAIVQASVFDAVNGIDRRYTPIHVEPAAPRGASRRAAAVQAAYASLVRLYPAQTSTLDAKRAPRWRPSREEMRTSDGQSVARGIEWGQTVADAIWAWRSTDGFTPPPPPFLGGPAVGEWRPTPPGFLPGAGPQFATMTPWVIASPSQFRPAGPPALTSARYAADFDETKIHGQPLEPLRSADQTLAARFWNSSTTAYLWNHVAVELGRPSAIYTLSENARLLALLNLAMADAAIACWDAKYHYVFWRPVTAIPLADTDGNPATAADPRWTPLLVTPNHPGVPVGPLHRQRRRGGRSRGVLRRRGRFSVDSDVMPGVVRSFGSFSGGARRGRGRPRLRRHSLPHRVRRRHGNREHGRRVRPRECDSPGSWRIAREPEIAGRRALARAGSALDRTSPVNPIHT